MDDGEKLVYPFGNHGSMDIIYSNYYVREVELVQEHEGMSESFSEIVLSRNIVPIDFPN